MKISKEKLLRIIKEECNQAMNAPAMASSGMAMDYLDQEGEMAKNMAWKKVHMTKLMAKWCLKKSQWL